MVQNLQTVEFKQFNGSLNLRDSENALPLGETPNIQNIEIESFGLKKLSGWEKIATTIPANVQLRGLYPYKLRNGEWRFVTLNYPSILLIDPLTGNYEYVTDSTGSNRWVGHVNTGKPFMRQAGDYICIVDGANPPVLLDQKQIREIEWPPAYTNDNNDVNNMGDSYLGQSANPVPATDIGFPSFCLHHKNRLWFNDVLNRRRLYASKNNLFVTGATSGFANLMGDNNPANFNIGFFVDVPCKTSLVAAEVISNEHAVIYCEEETLLLTGNHPTGTMYPGPHFDFNMLNDQIGAISPFLITKKGDNDHYFVTNKKTVYQTTLSDNFIQVKPKGLSSKIYPAFENLTNKTLARGYLVNHRLKGELHFFVPSANNVAYPDTDYVLNYTDGSDPEATWSKVGDFKPFRLRAASDIGYNNELYILERDGLYQANSGLSFNGSNIYSIYQWATNDFGLPKHRKRIVDITLIASSHTGANLKFYHLWEDGSSSRTTVSIPQTQESVYGSAIYGSSVYTSKAGKAFKETTFQINNRVGKQFKFRLEHDSNSEDFVIDKVIIRFVPLGQ